MNNRIYPKEIFDREIKRLKEEIRLKEVIKRKLREKKLKRILNES